MRLEPSLAKCKAVEDINWKQLAKKLKTDLVITTPGSEPTEHNPLESVFATPIVINFASSGSAEILYTREEAFLIAEEPKVRLKFNLIKPSSQSQPNEVAKPFGRLVSVLQDMLTGLAEFSSSEKLDALDSLLTGDKLPELAATLKSLGGSQALNAVEKSAVTSLVSVIDLGAFRDASKRAHVLVAERTKAKETPQVTTPISMCSCGTPCKPYEGIKMIGCEHTVCSRCLDTYSSRFTTHK